MSPPYPLYFQYENKHFWLVTLLCVPGGVCLHGGGGGWRDGSSPSEDPGLHGEAEPGTFPKPAAPMGDGEGRGRRPSWVPALNHLSIFINMQMSSGDGSPLPAGVNYLTRRR